jgi:hypothetical protein
VGPKSTYFPLPTTKICSFLQPKLFFRIHSILVSFKAFSEAGSWLLVLFMVEKA